MNERKQPKLLVCDTHPVQYRAPLWRGLHTHYPGCVHVVYASDCSTRGHNDAGFGIHLAWDIPLLENYPYTILNCEKGTPLKGWGSLTGENLAAAVKRHSPTAILITGLSYRYEWIARKIAIKEGIPLWIRAETQDVAFSRPAWKSALRRIAYTIAYRGITKFYYIGRLNYRHYIKHCVRPDKLFPAHYCTYDQFSQMSRDVKDSIRHQTRRKVGISDQKLVIGFCGKFIEKKNPSCIIGMVSMLPLDIQNRCVLYFVGSGEMDETLKVLAQQLETQTGILSIFTGFANQSELPPHYLAMDILVLPSRQMGETWGLVVNEALQAGCAVAVSSAVGCSADFDGLLRFRTYPEGDLQGLATAIEDLSGFERSFDWATSNIVGYSVEAAVEALHVGLMQA